MLQKMRSSIGSWIAKIILGLLVLSFMAWGIADYTGTGLSGTVVAEVGDREIDIQEFSREYNEFLQSNRLSAVEPETARDLQLAEQVLNQMTTVALYDAEAGALSLEATLSMVRRNLEGRQEFQSVTGGFSRQIFSDYLRFNSMSEAMMVETVRRDLVRSQLLGAITAGTEAPDGVVDLLLGHFGERRSARTIRLDIAGTPAAPVDDAALRAFFDERKEEFRQPELRQLTYVLISPEGIAETLDVSESAIETAFEQRRNEFFEPERRSVSQILFPSEEEAKTAADALQAASPDQIAATAETLGLAPIDLGLVTRNAVPVPDLAEAAFALSEPGASPAYQSDFGWAVAIVGEIVPAAEPALDDVRGTLSADLALSLAYDEVFRLGAALEDSYGQGASLEDAAAALNLPVTTVDAVDANGRGADGVALDGLPAGLTFLRIAQELAGEGEVSFLETTEDNSMFMVRLDRVIPSIIPDFDDVADTVREAYSAETQRDAAETRADALAQRLSAGGDIADIASELAVEVSSITAFDRGGQSEDGGRLPALLAQDLFALSVGGGAYAQDGDAFVVAQLESVSAVDATSRVAFRENLADAVAVGMARDLVEQLGAALRAKHPTKTHPDVYGYVYLPPGQHSGMGY